MDAWRLRPVRAALGGLMGFLWLGCLGGGSGTATAPGQVFHVGEPIRVRLPFEESPDWTLEDYEGRRIRTVGAGAGLVELGPLPVGFYRFRPVGGPADRWISLAVVNPLRVWPGTNSPVSLDVAMSWFYPPERMQQVAELCRRAGVVRVRDRLRWAELEPEPGKWAGWTRYDAAARVQRAAGLQVLQVVHDSPAWAGGDPRRFPEDLRLVYRFWQGVARRWAGQVEAFEPWNEADISVFGGHTGAEMAAYQKAAWWGIKSGNPRALVGWNVWAGARAAHLADLEANVAWPYFDTYNFHHYEPFDRYPELYGRHRDASGGRPIWVTECAWPVRWAGDARLQEPSEEDLRVQAERVVKTFAAALHEGAAAVFYFLLPHYVEGHTQFGLLRPDLTPRPGYVALAAVGRFLAEARPLGRARSDDRGLRLFVFRSRPDGRFRDVAVIWSESGDRVLALPVEPLQVWDHLGRRVHGGRHLKVGRAPLLVVLPVDRGMCLVEEPAPTKPVWRPGSPSPVVLQPAWPAEAVHLAQSAYRVEADRAVEIPIWVYHFGEQKLRVRFELQVPGPWEAHFPAEFDLEPGERRGAFLRVRVRSGPEGWIRTVRVVGRVDGAPDSAVSIRLMPMPLPAAAVVRQLPMAAQGGRWEARASRGGVCRVVQADGAVEVSAQGEGPDPWFYPELRLEPEEYAPARARGLAFWFLREGTSAIYRLIAEEVSGAAYVMDLEEIPPGEWRQMVVWLDQGVWGSGWSRPDPNGRLDADQIRVLRLGGNGAGPVRYRFRDLAWITD